MADRRVELFNLLGRLPSDRSFVTSDTISVENRGSYELHRLMLNLNGIEAVPAYLSLPLDRKPGEKLPVVLFNHSHGGMYAMGKEELVGGNNGVYMYRTAYAEDLARMGVAALAIDHWNFGERRGRSESELFKEMLWKGQVLWGMMVFDSLRAVDYLLQRDDMDPDRIGTLGMSMGSTMAWWLAALDERVKVCVDICCLTDFEELIRTRGLDGHGIFYFVPDLLNHFSTAEINELIAPRPHLSLAGNCDRLTPPAGLDKIDNHLRSVYDKLGAPDAWKLIRYDIGHLETAAMRKQILEFIVKWLVK